MIFRMLISHSVVSLERMPNNLESIEISASLFRHSLPDVYRHIISGKLSSRPRSLVEFHPQKVLQKYATAVGS